MRMHEMTRREKPRPAAPGGPPLTLAEKHALLLSQVATRVAALLATAAGDRWPARDLQALLGYLRAEVLCGAADEETLLFPAHGTSPGIARLERDHERLRACTDVLARAAAGEVTWSPAQVSAVTRDLFAQLTCHFAIKDALLASGVPDEAAGDHGPCPAEQRTARPACRHSAG